jgi:hypothetical protein
MAKSSERQTSTKAGVKSQAQKQDNARHGFKAQPASRKVAGASGLEGRGAKRQASASTPTPQPGKAAALRAIKTGS